MRVGLYYDMRNPPEWRRPWKGFYERTLEYVVESERVGIDAAWFTEHHGFEDGYLPQPLTMAAAAAARTKRIRIGTAIVLAPLRPAIDIAEQAAVVDLISDGRLELGLGAGYVIPEFRAFGVDPAGRFEAMEDRAVEIQRLWAEGLVTPGPLQDPLPIWIGGLGPRSARIAGRHDLGLLYPGPEALPVLRESLEKAGHDPAGARMGGLVQFVIADDPEEAWTRIKPHLAYQWKTYNHYGSLDTHDPGLMILGEVDPETLRNTTDVVHTAPKFDVVTPEQAISRLTAWMGDLPIDHVFCWTSIGGMPDDLTERHIELLSSKVAPAMRSVGIAA